MAVEPFVEPSDAPTVVTPAANDPYVSSPSGEEFRMSGKQPGTQDESLTTGSGAIPAQLKDEPGQDKQSTIITVEKPGMVSGVFTPDPSGRAPAQ